METHLYVTSELAMNIREARKNKGFRQEDLAVDGFLSTGTISKIERGCVSVSREKVTYLCEQLAIDLQQMETSKETEDEVDLSLKLLSIENHLNMVSPEEAWEELRKLRPTEELHRVWILYLKARCYEKRGKKEKAKILYLQVVENDDPELTESNFAAISYHALGRISFYEDRMEDALRYAEKGIAIFQAGGKRDYVLYFLKISQIIYLEKRNRNEEAMILLEKLWAEKKEIESREVILGMYEMKAELHNKFGNYEQAIQVAKEGLIKARINSMSARSCILWATLGECYTKKGMNTSAELCFHSALQTAGKMKNKYIIISIYLKQGQLFQKRGAHEQACKMFVQALKVASVSKDPVRLVETLITLGDHYEKINMTKKASETYLKAVSIDIINPNLKGKIYMRLAKCCYKNDKKEYYDYLDKFYQHYYENFEEENLLSLKENTNV